MNYDTAKQDICGVRQELAQREARLKSYLSFFDSYENEMRNYGRAWSKWYIVGLLLSCIILIMFTPTIRNVFYRVNRLLGPSHYPSFSDLISITNTLISSIPFLFMAFVCAEIMYRRRLDHVFDIQSQQKSRIESFLGRLQVLQQNLDEAVIEIKNASKEHRRPSIIPSGIDDTMDEFGLIVEEYKYPHSKYRRKYIRILVSSMLALSLVLLTTIPAFKAVLRLSATSYSPLYVRNIGMYISGLLLNNDETGSLFVLVSALYSLIYMGASTIIALCSKNTGGVFYVVACVAGHVAVLVLIALVLDLPIIVHLLIIFFFIWRRRTHS